MIFHLNLLLLGAIALASFTVGLFFLRFWRAGHDRFFLFFALSFFVQAANRVALALSESPNEGNAWHYWVRLVAYLLILVAIVEQEPAFAEIRPARIGCRLLELSGRNFSPKQALPETWSNLNRKSNPKQASQGAKNGNQEAQ